MQETYTVSSTEQMTACIYTYLDWDYATMNGNNGIGAIVGYEKCFQWFEYYLHLLAERESQTDSFLNY